MKAFITGATGQDGYYLIRELQDDGHEVHALYRGQDNSRFDSFKAEHPGVTWHRGDVTDASSIEEAVRVSKPDWVFNLAAASYVGNSWTMASLYLDTNTKGVLNVLEAVRHSAPEAHVIQASSSEMYGNERRGLGIGFNELSAMVPASPYGVSKLAAHRLCSVYRASYGMRVSSAISFNHESPRRPPIFVTRKITQAAARIKAGLQKELVLGNLDAERDWGYARDFMQAYILMAEQNKARDYVIATGECYSVRELVGYAFSQVGLIWQDYVTVEKGDRPNDLNRLLGDPQSIKHHLNWKAKTTFKELVNLMVDADLARVREVVAA